MVTTAPLTGTPTGCSTWRLVNLDRSWTVRRGRSASSIALSPSRVDQRHGNRILRVAAHTNRAGGSAGPQELRAAPESHRRLRTVLLVDGGQGIDIEEDHRNRVTESAGSFDSLVRMASISARVI